jgi:hypothetical protein
MSEENLRARAIDALTRGANPDYDVYEDFKESWYAYTQAMSKGWSPDASERDAIQTLARDAYKMLAQRSKELYGDRAPSERVAMGIAFAYEVMPALASYMGFEYMSRALSRDLGERLLGQSR